MRLLDGKAWRSRKEGVPGLEAWNRVMGGLEAWGRGGQGLSYGREGWPGLNNGKKRYSVGLDKNLKKIFQKMPPAFFGRFFLRFLSSSINYLSFSHCLALAIPPSHASSPAIPLFPMPQAHPQAHASSPCQAHPSLPCFKPGHASLLWFREVADVAQHE